MNFSLTDLINQNLKFNAMKISAIDIIEVIILSFVIYHVFVWIKKTRAWVIAKGFVVLFVFILFAWYFQMNTILWLVKNIFSIGITALVIVFQPELRKALEELGQQQYLSSVISLGGHKEVEARFTDKTVNELIRAVFEMGKVKTGALIVIEGNVPLNEYERTGIDLDAQLSSQLLVNIFEHNTPLHDGAIVVRGNRITSATCYLPLSDSMFLSKELGTRHRAAIGVSEVTDSLTIVVSEETGAVSVALGGELTRNIDEKQLREYLTAAQGKVEEVVKFKLWRGRVKKHETDATE